MCRMLTVLLLGFSLAGFLPNEVSAAGFGAQAVFDMATYPYLVETAKSITADVKDAAGAVTGTVTVFVTSPGVILSRTYVVTNKLVSSMGAATDVIKVNSFAPVTSHTVLKVYSNEHVSVLKICPPLGKTYKLFSLVTTFPYTASALSTLLYIQGNGATASYYSRPATVQTKTYCEDEQKYFVPPLTINSTATTCSEFDGCSEAACSIMRSADGKKAKILHYLPIMLVGPDKQDIAFYSNAQCDVNDYFTTEIVYTKLSAMKSFIEANANVELIAPTI